MTYAFTFDSSSCSGCKACQAACKDKNNLPVGVLWRRVYEVSGGIWQQEGDAWTNSVFAYNLSMSCNHCMHPKCAGVCPTDAYLVRTDGIVILDTTKCVGCGYCAWACPYGAPQYNAGAGTMTKCDLCFDNLEQGLPPACVAACPLRVLDYRDTATEKHIALWDMPATTHPYPLPSYSHTAPRLAIKPHAAMNGAEQKSLANVEETQPHILSGREEIPLIFFTLLVQMAVGGFWAMNWMFPRLWTLVEYDTTFLRLLPSMLIGVCVGIGMLISFAHLGTKKNAWRVLSHLRKSSLSKEILFTSLFGIGWLFTTLTVFLHRNPVGWLMLTAGLGLASIHSMAQVYRLPAATGWNSWRTNAGFIVSALLMGISAMAPLLVYESNITNIGLPSGQWTMINAGILVLVFAELVLMLKHFYRDALHNLRVLLLFIGMTLTFVGFLRPGLADVWFSILLLVVVLAEEGLGRWVFYRCRILP